MMMLITLKLAGLTVIIYWSMERKKCSLWLWRKRVRIKLFNEIVIGDDFKKLMKTLQLNYSKAVNFDQTMTLMKRIISFSDKRLAAFIANSFREIFSYLSIDTEILMSSDIPKDNSLRGKDKILQICEILGADTYYNATVGRIFMIKRNLVNMELYWIL